MLGIFLDSETNGLNPRKHKIVEIAFKIIDVDTGDLKDHYESLIFQSEDDWKLSDPESLQVNGFTWEKVKGGQKAEEAGKQVQVCFHRNGIKRGNAVFICQNPSFDRIFFSQLVDTDVQEKLLWPYHWLDLASMYWGEGIRKGQLGLFPFPWETGFSKDKIAKALGLPPEEKPHRAMNGVNHLLLCYESVVGFPNTTRGKNTDQ